MEENRLAVVKQKGDNMGINGKTNRSENTRPTYILLSLCVLFFFLEQAYKSLVFPAFKFVFVLGLCVSRKYRYM